jgi:hypothetical protein
MQDNVERHLTGLGWLGTDLTPLGALPTTFQRVRPQESQLQSITPNLVAVSFGPQLDDAPEQLGGGLVSQEHVVFVDVFAENEGIGLALSEDVRDLFTGRASYAGRNPSRFFRLEDQTTAPPTPVLGYACEITDVHREVATRMVANAEWQIVRATVEVLMPGET